MPRRIDLEATLALLEYPQITWDRLDLLGEVIAITDQQARHLDQWRPVDTADTALLVAVGHQQISSLTGIYVLIRTQLVHQAASHVRLFCEGLITLRYLTLSPHDRVPSYRDFSHIEAYNATLALLTWQKDGARQGHVREMEALLKRLTPEYERLLQKYQRVDGKGRKRKFVDWSGLSVSQRALQCGPEYETLYRSVYAQMSAYVHGSAWSLRHTASYSSKSFSQANIAVDVAAIIDATLVVWLRFGLLMDELFGSVFGKYSRDTVERVEMIRDTEAELDDAAGS